MEYEKLNQKYFSSQLGDKKGLKRLKVLELGRVYLTCSILRQKHPGHADIEAYRTSAFHELLAVLDANGTIQLPKLLF